MFLRILCVVLAFSGLAGCSPEFNWRQVEVAGAGVQAVFPDKPRTQQQKMNFAGEELEFFMTGTAVNDVVFAVGYASLPEKIKRDQALGEILYRQVVQSFYANLNLEAPAVFPGQGERFSVTGQSPNGPVTLSARVWVTADRLVEALVAGPQPQYPEREANEFFQSFKQH